jgi:hypothetical protein
MGCSEPFAASGRAQQEYMIPATTFDEHVVVSIAKRRRFNPRALGALLKARELLALSLGLLLAKVREAADPVQSLMARIKELEVLLARRRKRPTSCGLGWSGSSPGGAAITRPISASVSCCS